MQEQTQSRIEVTKDSIIDSISNSAAIPLQSSTSRIPRLPKMAREKDDYMKYYVPKVVSVGPYHFGNSNLQYAETLKPHLTMRLLKDNKETLRRLFDNLSEPETVQHLRCFYEENSTANFCDMEFSKMMLLDSCFILYYIRIFFGGSLEDHPELSRKQLANVYEDLLLLENQIPFEVLTNVTKLMETTDGLKDNIEKFISAVSFVRPRRRKRTWLQNIKEMCWLFCIRNDPSSNGGDADDDEKPTHLLAAVRGKLTKTVKTPKPVVNPFKYDAWNFRNVSELVDVGIYFKAIEQTTSLTHVDFVKNWWGFSANVKIPPITLYDETRQLLLNMTAYETYCCSIYDAWVTSYVCLLDSLIDKIEDVKVLRKGWVIHNHLSSDKEVATLFEEIAIDLFPNSLAYYEAMNKIQTHYESLSNTLFSQLKNEYFKSPWAIFALLGALIALFLAGVQTYFTVWSPESKCDDLCVFLKMNHHL
ncbi:hypothetical protein HanIR_Chr15g0732781 [Helianthus annuus]|nr:hypothetical protein HanIR_Chr15g0732781 [Helianthus annuus]